MGSPLTNFEQTVLLAVVEAVEAGAEAARAACPVQTGELRKSIRVETIAHANGDVTIALLAGGDPDRDGVAVNYAMDVEVANTPFLSIGAQVVRDRLHSAIRGAGERMGD